MVCQQKKSKKSKKIEFFFIGRFGVRRNFHPILPIPTERFSTLTL